MCCCVRPRCLLVLFARKCLFLSLFVSFAFCACVVCSRPACVVNAEKSRECGYRSLWLLSRCYSPARTHPLYTLTIWSNANSAQLQFADQTRMYLCQTAPRESQPPVCLFVCLSVVCCVFVCCVCDCFRAGASYADSIYLSELAKSPECVVF